MAMASHAEAVAGSEGRLYGTTPGGRMLKTVSRKGLEGPRCAAYQSLT
jgi:hypothetical protein